VDLELVAIIERVFKAAILVPIMALIGWWPLTNWLDRTLSARDALVGLGLCGVASVLGIMLIVRGGWGFLGIASLLYVALLAVACWEYTDRRRRERQRLLDEVARCREVIERDPSNGAAYSFLGEAHLRLRNFQEAAIALEKALEIDPESKRDRRLLRLAREGRSESKWRRLD